MLVKRPARSNYALSVGVPQLKGEPVRLVGEDSLYIPSEKWLAKPLSQVGRTASKKEIISNDAEIFEKVVANASILLVI